VDRNFDRAFPGITDLRDWLLLDANVRRARMTRWAMLFVVVTTHSCA
jgi:hypothetical protein